MKVAEKATTSINVLVKPTRWWSMRMWDVFENQRLVTRLEIPSLWEQPVFQVGARCFNLQRAGWWLNERRLQEDDRILCVAKRPWLAGEYVIEAKRQTFTLRDALCWRKRQLRRVRGASVEGPSVECGWIRPESMFSSRAIANLAADIPIEVRVFIVWIFISDSLAQQGA